MWNGRKRHAIVKTQHDRFASRSTFLSFPVYHRIRLLSATRVPLGEIARGGCGLFDAKRRDCVWNDEIVYHTKSTIIHFYPIQKLPCSFVHGAPVISSPNEKRFSQKFRGSTVKRCLMKFFPTNSVPPCYNKTSHARTWSRCVILVSKGDTAQLLPKTSYLISSTTASVLYSGVRFWKNLLRQPLTSCRTIFFTVTIGWNVFTRNNIVEGKRKCLFFLRLHLFQCFDVDYKRIKFDFI